MVRLGTLFLVLPNTSSLRFFFALFWVCFQQGESAGGGQVGRLEGKRRMRGRRVEKDGHLAQTRLQRSLLLYCLHKKCPCQQSNSVRMCLEKGVIWNGGQGHWPEPLYPDCLWEKSFSPFVFQSVRSEGLLCLVQQTLEHVLSGQGK